jgi:hypothetical protein
LFLKRSKPVPGDKPHHFFKAVIISVFEGLHTGLMGDIHGIKTAVFGTLTGKGKNNGARTCSKIKDMHHFTLA